jgi:DNA invertase Pin-like site-specific DNA recombinase
MHRYAQERGWSSVEYVESHTARTDERPKFQEMMADAEAGHLDVVMVYRLDRGFRNLEDQLKNLRHLREWGVAFVSLLEGFDDSSSHGKFTQNIKGAVNQYYSDLLSEKVKSGKAARVKDGKSNASRCPPGYIREPGGIDEIDPALAPAVRWAFETYPTGLHSYQELADYLNTHYPAPPNARDGRWTWSMVREMLMNPHYIGMVRHKGQLYPGQHPALIDRNLWERVQRARRSRPQAGKRASKQYRVHLLQGLLVCDTCGLNLGSQVQADIHTERWYYFDTARRKGIKCLAAQAGYIRQEILNTQITELIAAMRLPDDWNGRVADLMQYQSQRADVELQRDRLLSRRRNLSKQHEWGGIDDDEYKRRTANLQRELDALVVPGEPEVEQATLIVQELSEVWPDITTDEKRGYLVRIFEKITVDVRHAQIVRVKPKPAFVPVFQQINTLEEQNGEFALKGIEAIEPRDRRLLPLSRQSHQARDQPTN